MTHSQLNRRDWLRGAAVVSALGAVSTRARATLADRQRDVAWLDEVQQPPAQLPDKAPRLEPILKLTGNLEKDRAAWRKRRAEIQKWWTEFLHPFTDDRGAARKFKVVEQDRAAKTVVRQRIRYEVEPGVSTESYLLFPDTKQSTPGVVALHSTVQHSIRQPAGVEGKPEKAFGLRLAQQGCTVICPRNYLWPTNHKIDAQAEADRFLARRAGSKGMYKMLYDSQVALDILCAQPQVDVKRLGSVGHSLGAKEVVYLAAFDERVKVTVSSEGGIGVRFSNWNADWYLGPEIDKPS
ncbi:MAG: dienelactone hydrolase family protein, partial [Pirellulaceae bacterium]|nr:dienelactone hydrolase family protein [Pirellulaceae bacterium]